MKFSWQAGWRFLGLAFALATVGCSASAEPNRRSTRFVLFLDLSASVPPTECERWLGQAGRLVPDYGDSVVVFPLHEQTLAAGPLLEAEIPALGRDPGFDELARARKVRKQVRESLAGVLKKAFAESARSPATDVFSAIDRIRPDLAGRRTAVVFFSDMLNSTREGNLEKAPAVAPSAVPALIRSIGAAHGWSAATLRGVDVYCILNSLESGKAAPVNDRRILHRFFGAMFQSMGARLVVFDTHLGGVDVRQGIQ